MEDVVLGTHTLVRKHTLAGWPRSAQAGSQQAKQVHQEVRAREGVEPVEEVNLCAAQRDLCDRDLGLIFMRWPGRRSPLFPVALARPAWQRGELVRGRRQEGADTHHPQAADGDPLRQAWLAGKSLINYQRC